MLGIYPHAKICNVFFPRVARAERALHQHDTGKSKSRPLFKFHAIRGLFKSEVRNRAIWPMVVFALIYVVFLSLYTLVLPPRCGVQNANKTQGATKCLLSRFTKEGFEELVRSIKADHEMIGEIIAILLGFYVEIMMTRWWDQIESLPRINKVCVQLNHLVSNANGGLELKKSVLKNVLLAYALRLRFISPSLQKNLKNADDFDAIEIVSPRKYRELSELGLKNDIDAVWWVPINKAGGMLRDAHESQLFRHEPSRVTDE